MMSDSDDVSVPKPPMPPLHPQQPVYIPVGSIVAFAGQVLAKGHGPGPLEHTTDVVPMGWMVCDGRALYISEYPALFETIGFLYGKGKNGETFNIPDYRGYFLRCIGTGEGSQEERKAASEKGETDGVGSTQEDAVLAHAHDYEFLSEHSPGEPGSAKTYTPGSTPKQTTGPLTLEGAPLKKQQVSQYETRPKNVFVHYLIKCF
jgi:microcystin-dependent protein